MGAIGARALHGRRAFAARALPSASPRLLPRRLAREARCSTSAKEAEERVAARAAWQPTAVFSSLFRPHSHTRPPPSSLLSLYPSLHQKPPQISAIVVYIVCGLFSKSFITNFVVVVVLLMADFWMVSGLV